MKRGRIIALIAVIVLAVALARCHPQGPGGDMVYCGVSALPPTQTGTTGHFAAHGQYRCDKPGADVLEVTVQLEKRGSDNAWVVVASRTATAKGAATTTARGDRQRSVDSVGFECQDGSFRSTVVAVEQSKGHRATLTNHSPTIKRACIAR